MAFFHIERDKRPRSDRSACSRKGNSRKYIVHIVLAWSIMYCGWWRLFPVSFVQADSRSLATMCLSADCCAIPNRWTSHGHFYHFICLIGVERWYSTQFPNDDSAHNSVMNIMLGSILCMWENSPLCSVCLFVFGHRIVTVIVWGWPCRAQVAWSLVTDWMSLRITAGLISLYPMSAWSQETQYNQTSALWDLTQLLDCFTYLLFDLGKAMCCYTCKIWNTLWNHTETITPHTRESVVQSIIIDVS